MTTSADRGRQSLTWQAFLAAVPAIFVALILSMAFGGRSGFIFLAEVSMFAGHYLNWIEKYGK